MARKDALLRLHTRLITRRDALRKALNGDLDSLRELAKMGVGDSVDAAVDTANDEINSQIIEIESRELEQIEHALQRIVDGVYGRCESCGEKIAEARINALPYTNSCINCQREIERFGQGFSRDGDESRWNRVFEAKPHDESDNDKDVNLSDFEMDLSESGR